VTGSLVVAGVSAYHLWRTQHVEASRLAFSIAIWAATFLVPLQIFLGDAQGRNTLEYQPTKLAAMEGLWDSGSGVPAAVIGWPDAAQERNLFEIAIPHAASVYLTHSWNGYVQGLKAVPASDRPNVPIVFFAFRIMAGIGILLLLLVIVSLALRWKGQLYTNRWFQVACMLAMPLGFVAVLAGWTVTETGRQPFVVYGLLRTADAVSPVATGAVLASLLMFVVVYNLLLLAVFWYGARIVMKGPDPYEETPPNAVRPGRVQAGPAILGGYIPANARPATGD
jgi:cytochrome d ubiquinol oxidase subunit I